MYPVNMRNIPSGMRIVVMGCANQLILEVWTALKTQRPPQINSTYDFVVLTNS